MVTTYCASRRVSSMRHSNRVASSASISNSSWASPRVGALGLASDGASAAWIPDTSTARTEKPSIATTSRPSSSRRLTS